MRDFRYAVVANWLVATHVTVDGAECELKGITTVA